MGLDSRESTPGFKRQLVFINGETRSFHRASLLMERVNGIAASPNTIERICLEVGNDLAATADQNWEGVLQGEAVVPQVAIVGYDGGRIRLRQPGCGPGVHLQGKGWKETKNAIFVSATSETSLTDPEPNPPECFLDPKHVAKLTETAKTREKAGINQDRPDHAEPVSTQRTKRKQPPHKPRRVQRTVISSMRDSKQFGQQMAREAKRRRFGEAQRKAFIGDGLACNWTIQQTHFRDYVPVLDFVHAVSYLFEASLLCCGKGEESWSSYAGWLTLTWRGQVRQVIHELCAHQERIGLPPPEVDDDDPREQLRLVIQYLRNNEHRMRYDDYRRQGLPTTSAWMESAVKEINYRTKGTDMFWNDPAGAEAILQLRAASLSDDDRLARFLTNRPGTATVRKGDQTSPIAA